LEDIDEFAQEFRVLSGSLSGVPWATYDFTTMYEALVHEKLINGVMKAVQEAWESERERVSLSDGRRPEVVELRLGETGWVESKVLDGAQTEGMWLTMDGLREILQFMLSHLFVHNGKVIRRQRRGVPMGLECAPQLANLYGYAIESEWVEQNGSSNVMSWRYIDDIFVAGPDAEKPGVGLPTEEDYGMQYKCTSESPHSLLYLGLRLFKDDKGQAQCTLHDRAVEYPIRIDRYPHVTTVANPQQLSGVIMGRLVAAQRQCSRVDYFKDTVAGIMTHAHRRGYSRRLLHSTWTRFLTQYWDAAGVTTKELRRWFHQAWKSICLQPRGQGGSSGKWLESEHHVLAQSAEEGSVTQNRGGMEDNLAVLLSCMTPPHGQVIPELGPGQEEIPLPQPQGRNPSPRSEPQKPGDMDILIETGAWGSGARGAGFRSQEERLRADEQAGFSEQGPSVSTRSQHSQTEPGEPAEVSAPCHPQLNLHPQKTEEKSRGEDAMAPMVAEDVRMSDVALVDHPEPQQQPRIGDGPNDAASSSVYVVDRQVKENVVVVDRPMPLYVDRPIIVPLEKLVCVEVEKVVLVEKIVPVPVPIYFEVPVPLEVPVPFLVDRPVWWIGWSVCQHQCQ
jgi:hypothetical protein